MTKNELIANIQAEHEKLHVLLAKLAPEDMLVPGVAGDWSIKDILAHLAVWTSRAVTLLFQAERNGKPIPPESKMPDWSDVNAKDYASQKDRPLDRILADFNDSHAQLVKRLENWTSEADLFDKERYPTLKGYSLAEHVWGDTGEHDAEHRAQIEARLSSR